MLCVIMEVFSSIRQMLPVIVRLQNKRSSASVQRLHGVIIMLLSSARHVSIINLPIYVVVA